MAQRPAGGDRIERIAGDQGEPGLSSLSTTWRSLARYAGPDRHSAAQQQELKSQIQGATQKVYALSRRILQADTQAANEFNALLKGIRALKSHPSCIATASGRRAGQRFGTRCGDGGRVMPCPARRQKHAGTRAGMAGRKAMCPCSVVAGGRPVRRAR
jgi:hypothetical protein